MIEKAKAAAAIKNPWFLISFCIAAAVLLPVVMILFSSLSYEPDIWIHLKTYLLPELIQNTLILSSGVLLATFILGVSLAFLTSMCEFPGRALFSWALLLPLAMPAYVMAFVYTGLLDFSGPVRTFLRTHLPAAAPFFPEIRSTGGVILVMSLALYPYVFLLAGSGFSSQGENTLEAARSMGKSRTNLFFRIILPMARPWIFGGLILVFMETLADFGTVSIFNYNTFTTAIYKAWFGLFSIGAATRLSSILVFIVIFVLSAEYTARRKMRFFRARSQRPRKRLNLVGWKASVAWFYCVSIFILAFAAPVTQLIVWTCSVFSEEFTTAYLRLLEKSLILGFSGAALTIVCACVIAFSERINKGLVMSAIARLSTLGYALPGTVLAVGMVKVIAVSDNLVLSLNRLPFVNITGQVFQGSVLTMLIAYMVRFMSAGYGSVSGSLSRITPSMDEAARTMGTTGLKLFTSIHLPLMRNGILTGLILVFVDIMKEMPITLMTRPFGWDTLAVKIFELTSEGEWERAALPAVALVAAGLIPVIFLTKQRGE